MNLYPNTREGQKVKTDIKGISVDLGFLAHFQVLAANATVAATDGIHDAVTCTTPAIAATAELVAASAAEDTLTITFPASLGDTPNGITIEADAAEDDTLAVSKDDEANSITIALADTTPAKNTAALIQAAIRALTSVGGVSLAAVTCTAAGNWDTAAVDVTAETEEVEVAGGQTAVADTVTTEITDPSVPRNITATAGGTSGDIGAIQVIITGTNYQDEEITETLPVFTVNTPGTVAGSKAFKTVTSIEIPAHDGTGATTAIGFGEKLGLPFKLAHNTVLAAFLDNTLEGTAPTVAVSSSALESNTVDLNSALDSKVVDVYLIA